MIDDATIGTIRQKRFDSLAAKHLHVKRRDRLNWWSRLADFLALGVPISYFAFRLIARGTSWQWLAEISWEILATALLVLVALKMNYRWEETAQIHSKLLGENISLARQADGLLTGADVSPSVQLFLSLADRSEKEDRDSLGEPQEKDQQFAYRKALKESGGTTVVCPICHLSPWRFARAYPWKFARGSCQLCGNKPE
jgi:mobilome CxxCx(11)CxxC protein